MTEAMTRALRSLEGLSLGDAFGELAFEHNEQLFGTHTTPPGPWRWTDDTQMAMSVVEQLRETGAIDADALAARLARRFTADPERDYADGARQALTAIAAGTPWAEAAAALFDGEGSFGNGAGARVAPLGAWFAGDPARAAAEALKAAAVTHAHAEGRAGAAAVAAMAALVAAGPGRPTGEALIRATREFVPEGEVRDNMDSSLQMEAHERDFAIHRLGCGWRVTGPDTIPFALWCAAHHLEDFEEAIWFTARALGDCDTNCAIVGGIVALSAPDLPAAWMAAREPLPPEFGV